MDTPWSARCIIQFETYLVHVLLSLAMISNEPFVVPPCTSLIPGYTHSQSHFNITVQPLCDCYLPWSSAAIVGLFYAIK
jgi:hypothetical protein